MKLSIIIPVYNEKKTVAEIIKRVFASPIKLEKEVIVVDDGSTDDSFVGKRSWRQVYLFGFFGSLGTLFFGFLRKKFMLPVYVVWYFTPRTGGGRYSLPYLPAFSFLAKNFNDEKAD